MSAATCETAPRVRPERKTVAPWSANSLATAVPTAPPAPKMTARLFFNKDVDVDTVFIRSLPFNACSREQFIFLLRSRNQAADRGAYTGRFFANMPGRRFRPRGGGRGRDVGRGPLWMSSCRPPRSPSPRSPSALRPSTARGAGAHRGPIPPHPPPRPYG